MTETTLDTDPIRGVALAGEQMTPTIIVDLTSPDNTYEEGRRFSIAHELCHVLVNRGHARRAWSAALPAPPGVRVCKVMITIQIGSS